MYDFLVVFTSKMVLMCVSWSLSNMHDFLIEKEPRNWLSVVHQIAVLSIEGQIEPVREE